MTDYMLLAMVLSGIGILCALYVFYNARSAKRLPILSGSASAYFDSIKNLEPEEGIDYIVNYIRNPKWGCPSGDLLDFLIEMAERSDGFGAVARRKMRELGFLPAP